MTERVLSRRELNRAVLARQYLLERAEVPPLEAIRHLVALQGQVSNAPYVALWTRLRAFERAELAELLHARRVVRASSLRNTLHLLAAEDYLLIQPLVRDALSRTLHLFAQRTAGFDLKRFVAEMRAYVREQPRTAADLRAAMERFSRGMGEPRIADGVRISLGLLQIPPAGTWGFTGKPLHTEAEAWLGRPLAAEEDGPRRLIPRYLAAFGPAGAKDILKWSGLSGMRAIQQAFEALRPELVTFRDEQGAELFDLPDAPRPAAETMAPVRILPAFDNLLVAYADRERIIARADVGHVYSNNGYLMATVLVDGFVRGVWKIERRATGSVLLIETFGPLPSATRADLLDEGERLVRWMSDGKAVYTLEYAVRDVSVKAPHS